MAQRGRGCGRVGALRLKCGGSSLQMLDAVRRVELLHAPWAATSRQVVQATL